MTTEEQVDSKPKIYCFAEGVPQWYHVTALAEDGNVLAGHLSSSISFAKHDIGINSDRKHDKYKDHYPSGYDLEWVDENELKTHEGFNNAYKENQKLAQLPEKNIVND